MQFLRASALSLFLCAIAAAQNATLMPVPKLQFFNASGIPLAGGFVYTCAAGTTCPGNPLAAYTDSTAATALPNPVVLDAGGFAAIWLSNTAAYKIVVQDLNGVTQWTVDNVQSPGLLVSNALATPLATLNVTGNATIGGQLTANGATFASGISATTGTFSGILGVGGATTLSNTLQVSSNTSIGGYLSVAGTSTLTGNTTMSGTLGVSGVATAGGFGLNDGTENFLVQLGAGSHSFLISDITNSTAPLSISPNSPSNSLELMPTSVRINNVPWFSGPNTTGTGAAAMGSNSPAVAPSTPYTWIKITTADGTTAYIPAWR